MKEVKQFSPESEETYQKSHSLTCKTRRMPIVQQLGPGVGNSQKCLQTHLWDKKDVHCPVTCPGGGKLTEVLQPHLWDEEGGQATWSWGCGEPRGSLEVSALARREPLWTLKQTPKSRKTRHLEFALDSFPCSWDHKTLYNLTLVYCVWSRLGRQLLRT